MKRNKGQEEAVSKINGQLVIIACPGSGKTTTLISRIHAMIESGIAPDTILMMTFSKAAAEEMSMRYQKQFKKNPGITFSTIHAFCFSILCRFFGYNGSSVLRETEKYSFLRDAVRSEKKIPAKDREEFVTALMLDISNVKNAMARPCDITPKCCQDKELFEKLYNKYIDYGKEAGKIDFDDMLTQTLIRLKESPEVVSWLRNHFQYIQVDEYQDTNLVQAEIIYLIAGENGNLAVVGDDDQSIYGFRGADPSVMMDFTKRYPKAQKVFLSTNYRSKNEIIAPARRLVERNKNRFKKDFLCSRGNGGRSDVSRHLSRNAQLSELSGQIRKLLDLGEDPSEIAVLYRTNRQADQIAGRLMDDGIAFHSTENVVTRYESFIYEDIKMYKEAADTKNPAFVSRIMNHPNRFFHPDMAKCGLNKDKMLMTARRVCKEDWQKEKCQDKALSFVDGMEMLSAADNPADGLKVLSAYLDYPGYIREYASFRGDDPEDYMGIYRQLSDDIQKHNIKTWEAWDSYGKKYVRQTKEVQREAGRDSVTLSTMHKSKGLEWKHVFIVDAVKQKCPLRHPGRGALTLSEKEEERRLFYVAVTRAKDYLHVMYYGTPSDASPYIKEMQLTQRKESLEKVLERR